MTPTERAREMADSLSSTVTTIVFGDSFEMDQERATEMIEAAIAEVAAEARREALGEVATVASEMSPEAQEILPNMAPHFRMGHRQARDEAQVAIRALIDRAPESEPDPTRALAKFFKSCWDDLPQYVRLKAEAVALVEPRSDMGFNFWVPTEIGHAALKIAEGE